MLEWTEERIQKIQDILACYPVSRFQEALRDLRKEFGRPVTSATLRGLFQRQGLPSPTSFCQKTPSRYTTSAPKKPIKAEPPKTSKISPTVHVVIGDTQVKPGVPTAHLGWIGRYLVDHFAGRDIRLIHVGDHWDMPSLSSYDKGKGSMEGRRYRDDINAGNAGMDLLMAPIAEHNIRQLAAGRSAWEFDKHFTLGNHEERIARAIEENVQLDGTIGYHDFNLNKWGWTVHPYLKPVILEGVGYVHFYYNPNTGRPYAGENLHLRLKTIGHSFVQGHQQGLAYAVRATGTGQQFGLVCGSSYLHDEKYLGPQGNGCWRGIVILHQVEGGSADPMMVSLDFLCRRYEGMRLSEYMKLHP